MGNKAGYAEVILGALGLRSGSGADAYLWAEADPDVRALLRAYPDAAMLTRIAEIIRGWADEEPRALWERLRAERKARGPESAQQTAEWVAVQGVQYGSYPLWTGTSGGFDSPAGTLSMHPNRLPDGGGLWPATASDACASLAAYATIAASSRWPPVAVLSAIPTAADVALWLGTPGDLSGCVVYMDPPYVGTTGYGSNLTRDEVIDHALDFDALGAVVCISEAEPVIDTWYATEITGGRRGQKRTFSKQQAEYLTMNRPPHATVATQVSMFGAPT